MVGGGGLPDPDDPGQTLLLSSKPAGRRARCTMQQRALAPWPLPPNFPAYKSEVLPPPPRVGP